MGKKKARYVAKGFDNGIPKEVEVQQCDGFRIYDPNGRWLDLKWDEKLQAFELYASGPVTLEPRVSNTVHVCVKRF